MKTRNFFNIVLQTAIVFTVLGYFIFIIDYNVGHRTHLLQIKHYFKVHI